MASSAVGNRDGGGVRKQPAVARAAMWKVAIRPRMSLASALERPARGPARTSAAVGVAQRLEQLRVWQWKRQLRSRDGNAVLFAEPSERCAVDEPHRRRTRRGGLLASAAQNLPSR